MRALKQVQPADPTPEQLLRLLDVQILQQRARRRASSARRAAILMAGLLIILAGTAFALYALFSKLESARETARMHIAAEQG
jgi:hypothetical protein